MPGRTRIQAGAARLALACAAIACLGVACGDDDAVGPSPPIAVAIRPGEPPPTCTEPRDGDVHVDLVVTVREDDLGRPVALDVSIGSFDPFSPPRPELHALPVDADCPSTRLALDVIEEDVIGEWWWVDGTLPVPPRSVRLVALASGGTSEGIPCGAGGCLAIPDDVTHLAVVRVDVAGR